MAENVETINKFLSDKFGIDTETKNPIFRVVFSDEQIEKRETKYTDTGIELLHTEIRELPKYPHIDGAYVLERYVLVPDINLKELAGLKKSYEPLYVFTNSKDQRVRPTILACEYIIDCLYAALGKTSLRKYIDPDSNSDEARELKKKRVDQLYEEMYGDESSLNGETHNESGSAIIVPSNYRSH